MPELTYRYRLYPTEQQEKDIRRNCSCARFIYNKLLEDRTKHYRETKEWKKIDASPYRSIPFMIQADPGIVGWAENSLNTAYRKFFHTIKTKPDRYSPESIERAGKEPAYKLMDTDLVSYPKFKKKKTSRESYTTFLRNPEIRENRILLPGVGRVKIRLHRPIPEDAKQVSATVLKKPCGHYYLLFRLRFPEAAEKKDLEQPIGVVYARGKLAVRSDGEPVLFRHQEEHLTKRIQMAGKGLSRRTPGSKRYEELRLYMAGLYEHRVNQRRDDLHKAARQITNAGDTFYLQQPDVMNQISHMTEKEDRKIQMDEAWWTFYAMVRYKSLMEGKRFWTVPRAFPTYSICSACGHWMKQETGDNWHCPECGAKLERHENAAKNLRNLGIKYIQEIKEMD